VSSPYLVPVAQLIRDVPSSISVTLEAPFDEPHEFTPRGYAETDVFSEATVNGELRVESFSGGLRVRGRVQAPWHGICRRCSTPVLGLSIVEVNERFVNDRAPDDDEAYEIENDFVDLAPMVHDAIFLDLPLAPLCREDCLGLCPYCGVDRNDESCDCQSPVDPRWATLDELRFIDFQADESKEV
jgi:uncharacterized protein